MKKFVIQATFELKQRSGDYGCERFTCTYGATTEKKALAMVNKQVRDTYGGYGAIKNIRVVDVREINEVN
jgi:hypothetical protein